MSTILIIDDDVKIIESLKIILESNNYNTFTAENGEVALKYLDKQRPDIILLDIIMPDMEGIEALRKCKSRGLTVPVIIMSGHPIGQGFFKIAELLGAKESLKKPFTYKELQLVLNRYI